MLRESTDLVTVGWTVARTVAGVDNMTMVPSLNRP
jgi:hypothetical protein